MKGRIGKALPWGKGAAWAAALVLPPITAAYFMQLAYGVAPWQMAPLAVVGNGVCLGVLYYLLCALTGRWVVACLILHLASGLWGAANYFVSVYRGNPVLPWDLTALETAAAVSGTYDFTPTLPMVLALVLLVGLGILLVMRLRTGRMRWALRGGCLLACALCLTPVLHPEKLAFFGIKTDVWDQAGAYRTSGAMGAFLRNTEFLEVEKPEGLTVQRLAQLLGQEEDGTASATQVEDLPNVIAISFEKIFQGIGEMKITMYLLIAGCVVNIILDPILIFGLLGFPALGVAGAAIATVIGQISALLLYIIVYRRNSYAVHISFKHLVFDKAIIRQIYSVGIPSTVMMLLPSILISVLNSILTAFSDVYVAVLGVYFKLQTFIYMPANGIVQGMRPIIGYNYGAGESSRVKSTIRYSLLTAAGLMLTGTILALALPKQILALFDADAALMSAGVTALRIISLGFLVSSVGLIYSGVFEAIGNGRNSLIISLLRQFVITIPLSFILTRFFGPTGVWISFPVGELCASAAAFCLLKKYQNGAFSPL